MHVGEREDLKLGQESRDRLLFGELTLCLRAGMRQGGVSAQSLSLVVRSSVGDHCPSRRPPQCYTFLRTVFRCTHGKVMLVPEPNCRAWEWPGRPWVFLRPIVRERNIHPHLVSCCPVR